MDQESSSGIVDLSNRLADAVAAVDPVLVTVDGRRRRPASGFALGDDLVLTASHVVEREENLSVITHDGRTLEAEFAGRDPSSDLAVLRVADLALEGVAPTTAAPRVGQLVLAVGRPDGGAQMASLGVISSIGGPLRTRRGGVLEQYLRTDAVPYPGFSGGPLVGAGGQVLGMLTTGLAGGTTLAIPMTIADPIARSLATHGSVRRGYLGISSQPVRIPAGQRAGLEQGKGLLVMRIEAESPADQGGLLLGDILVTFDGVAVRDTSDLQALLMGSRVGNAVPVEVLRGGEQATLTVTVGER